MINFDITFSYKMAWIKIFESEKVFEEYQLDEDNSLSFAVLEKRFVTSLGLKFYNPGTSTYRNLSPMGEKCKLRFPSTPEAYDYTLVFNTGVNVPINEDQLNASLDTPEFAAKVEDLVDKTEEGYHESQIESRKEMSSSEIVLHFLKNFESIILDKMNIKERKCIIENTLPMEKEKIAGPAIKTAKKKITRLINGRKYLFASWGWDEVRKS